MPMKPNGCPPSLVGKAPGEKATVVAEIVERIEALTAELGAAEQETRRARNRETDLLNRLNEQQKALDKALDALKIAAPMQSDWRTRERFRSAVEEPK